MRKAALLLLLVAGPAMAQPKPPPEPERKPTPGEPRLNLKLDEADLRSLSRNTSGPPVEKSDGLPSLGDDARPLPRPDTRSTNRSYPTDSQRGER